MRTGYTISAIGHALVLGWGLVSFSAKPFEVPPADAVVADVISETEFSQLTAGSKTAQQTSKPTPVVDKIGDVKAPSKVPQLKVADKPEVQTETAPPPAPLQPDLKPPEQKLPESKPEPKPAPSLRRRNRSPNLIRLRKPSGARRRNRKKRPRSSKKRASAKRLANAKKPAGARRLKSAKK